MSGINITAIITVTGILVALANIIVEVVKKVTWDKIPTNIVAVIVSLILTFTALFIWISVKDIEFKWYYIAAAVIVGFMVSYAAMFGFDKLKETLREIGEKTEE